MEDLQINGRCIRLVTPDEQALLEALYQHEDGGAIARVLAGILDRLREARAKHGRFAEQVYHALSFLSEEHGEVVREITKSKDGWESRMARCAGGALATYFGASASSRPKSKP